MSGNSSQKSWNLGRSSADMRNEVGCGCPHRRWAVMRNNEIYWSGLTTILVCKKHIVWMLIYSFECTSRFWVWCQYLPTHPHCFEDRGRTGKNYAIPYGPIDMYKQTNIHSIIILYVMCTGIPIYFYMCVQGTNLKVHTVCWCMLLFIVFDYACTCSYIWSTASTSFNTTSIHYQLRVYIYMYGKQA